MDLRQAINDGRMSAYQWFVVALTVLLNMLDGFDVLAFGFTSKSVQAEMGLSGLQIGSLMSAGLIGMMLGALLLAPLADRFGRRPVLLLATALSAVGMGMTYFARSADEIWIWRALTGIGVGGILTCTNVIVSEYANRRWRHLAIAIYASGFGVGAMLGGMSAVFLQGEYGWRSVFMVGAVLTLIAWVILFVWLPESVDFLMTRQPPDARTRLQAIARRIGLAGDWPLPPKPEKKQKISVLRLFEREYLRNTLLIWVAFVAVTASYYFVSSWTPNLLETAGMKKEESQTVGMAISLGGTFGSLLFGFLASRWHARHMLIGFTVLSALAVVAFVFSHTLALALVMAVAVGSLMNGCITGLYTINPSLYAAEFRSTGVGMAIGVGRIGAIASPVLGGKLLDGGWQKDDLYLGIALIILVATVALALLKPRNTH